MSFEDIKYVPSLEPDKNYKSDIDYSSPLIEDAISENIEIPTEEVEETIFDKLESASNMAAMLPDSIKTTVQNNIELIEEYTNKIKAKRDDPDPESDVDPSDEDPEQPTPPTPNDPGYPKDPDYPSYPDYPSRPGYPVKPDNTKDQDQENEDIISNAENMPFVVPIVSNIIDDRDELEYDTFTEILEDFLAKLQRTVISYINGINHYLLDSGTQYDPIIFEQYEKKSSDLPDNLKHVGDEIIKSQIIRNQKGRLFNKVSHNDNLATFLNQIVLAHIKYQKYQSSSHFVENTTVDMFTNRELDNAKRQLKIQNRSSLYNLYKQLNSSNVVLGDYMSMQTREVQLKIILLKEGCLHDD